MSFDNHDDGSQFEGVVELHPSSRAHNNAPHLQDVRVPEPLRDRPYWLIWRAEQFAGELKPRKVPYYADGVRRHGEQGSPADLSKLTTFAMAQREAIRRGFDGVGFAHVAGGNIITLDFDNCVKDGVVRQDVLDLVSGTYAEYSPSGNGIHAIFSGPADLLANRKTAAKGDDFAVEAFSSTGFTTFSGWTLDHIDLLGYEDKIAPIPQTVVEACHSRFGASSAATFDADDFMAGFEPRLGLSVEKMQELLSYLDPGMGREPWLRVGMALHHECDDDTGFDLWDEWSQGGQSYPSTEELRYQWDSLKPKPGKRLTTMASVIKMAKEAGYVACVSSSWTKPRPLPSSSGVVPALAADMLPAELRPWLLDIAERMNVPLDFVAIPAMVMLGALVGRRIAVRPERNTDWSETANLWGAIIAPPGAMKSPAVAQVFEPIAKLEEDTKRANREAEIVHEAKLMAHKVARDAAIKEAKKHPSQSPEALFMAHAEDPPKPKLKRYITSDATVEKLGEICADNPNGVLYHRDELPSLLFDLQREEKVASRGFLLSGWGGMSSYTFDRIGRGMIHVEAVNISLFGTAQPQRMTKLVADAAQKLDDGMVQRLQLLTWPDMPKEWKLRDVKPDQQARDTAFACCRRLAELVPEDVSAETDDLNPVPFLRFSADAYHAFNAYRQDLETRLRSGELEGLLAGHLAKFRGLVPRIALVLHLSAKGSGPVSLEAMEAALLWAAYLEGHARRVYGSTERQAVDAAKLLLERIMTGSLGSQFTKRDVTQKKWTGLGDNDAARAALELLLSHDWLRLEEVKSGGRPTVRYHVNPAAIPVEAICETSE